MKNWLKVKNKAAFQCRELKKSSAGSVEDLQGVELRATEIVRQKKRSTKSRWDKFVGEDNNPVREKNIVKDDPSEDYDISLEKYNFHRL